MPVGANDQKAPVFGFLLTVFFIYFLFLFYGNSHTHLPSPLVRCVCVCVCACVHACVCLSVSVLPVYLCTVRGGRGEKGIVINDGIAVDYETAQKVTYFYLIQRYCKETLII